MTSPVFQPPAETDVVEDPASDSQAATKPEAEKVPSPEEWTRTLAALKKANKDAEAHRKRLTDIEEAKKDADKSEAEKRAAAEQRAVDAEMRATRLEVAHEKGLTPAQAKRLVGATREELEADADEILRDFPVTPPKPAAPKPDPSQGAKGDSPARAKTLTEAIAAQRSKALGG
jgi:hypothetical protein